MDAEANLTASVECERVLREALEATQNSLRESKVKLAQAEAWLAGARWELEKSAEKFRVVDGKKYHTTVDAERIESFLLSTPAPTTVPTVPREIADRLAKALEEVVNTSFASNVIAIAESALLAYAPNAKPQP
jgi:hypothetical protein